MPPLNRPDARGNTSRPSNKLSTPELGVKYSSLEEAYPRWGGDYSVPKPSQRKWVDCILRITHINEYGSKLYMDVVAQVCGPFAIFKGLKKGEKFEGKWALYHIPTTRYISHLLISWHDASGMAGVMMENVAKFITIKDHELTLRLMPPWVHPWAVACNMKGRCLGHQAFVLAVKEEESE